MRRALVWCISLMLMVAVGASIAMYRKMMTERSKHHDAVSGLSRTVESLTAAKLDAQTQVSALRRTLSQRELDRRALAETRDREEAVTDTYVKALESRAQSADRARLAAEKALAASGKYVSALERLQASLVKEVSLLTDDMLDMQMAFEESSALLCSLVDDADAAKAAAKKEAADTRRLLDLASAERNKLAVELKPLKERVVVIRAFCGQGRVLTRTLHLTETGVVADVDFDKDPADGPGRFLFIHEDTAVRYTATIGYP